LIIDYCILIFLANATTSSNLTTSNITNITSTSDQIAHSTAYYLGIYFALLIGFLIFNVLAWVVGFLLFAISASRALHFTLIERLVNATVTFFDVTPVARISTRLTLDLFLIDFVLPAFFLTNFNIFFQIIGSLAGINIGLRGLILNSIINIAI
jgi:hypothetical protein